MKLYRITSVDVNDVRFVDYFEGVTPEEATHVFKEVYPALSVVTVDVEDEEGGWARNGQEVEVIESDEFDQFNSDAEADADVLRSAGWGTDEDYGSADEVY